MNPFLLMTIVSHFFNALYILIVLRVVISWMRMRDNNPISRFVATLTDPLISPAQKLVRRSPLGGSGVPLDISPLVTLFVLSFVSESIIAVIVAVYVL